MKIVDIREMIVCLETIIASQHRAVEEGNIKAEPWLAVAVGACSVARELVAVVMTANQAAADAERARAALGLMWPTIKYMFNGAGLEIPTLDVEEDPEPEPEAEGGSNEGTLN